MSMSSENQVIEITHLVSSMLHKLPVTDAVRALIANISCGVCTIAGDEEQLERFTFWVKATLDKQIREDWLKIKELKKTGGTSNMVSISESRN
jgi:hypothetical protein